MISSKRQVNDLSPSKLKTQSFLPSDIATTDFIDETGLFGNKSAGSCVCRMERKNIEIINL